MNLIFFNYFNDLVTTKRIVSDQIMITRNAATDRADSAVEIGIIEYYFDKGLRPTAKYIKCYLSYRKRVTKSYIVN